MAARDRAKLRRVVDDLVVVQGNEFVKELLRSKKLRIGATKADFEASARRHRIRRTDHRGRRNLAR